MADFFDKMKQTIDKGVATVSVKSTSLIEVNKIKLQITQLKERIDNLKIEAGELLYSNYKGYEVDDETYARIFKEIDSLYEEIKEKEDTIAQIKKEEAEALGTNRQKQCSCGNLVDSNAQFCNVCGRTIN